MSKETISKKEIPTPEKGIRKKEKEEEEEEEEERGLSYKCLQSEDMSTNTVYKH
jgi:hypothetical protein